MAERTMAPRQGAPSQHAEGDRIARGIIQQSRLEKLWKEVRKRDRGDEVDLIVLPNMGLGMSANFRYVTGFTNGRFEQSFLLLKERKVTLITDRIEAEPAEQQKWPGMEILVPHSSNSVLKELSDRTSGKVIGFDGVSLPSSYLRMLIAYHKPKGIVDVAPAFITARQVKDLNEVAQIVKATAIARRTLVRVPEFLRRGITELQLAAELDYTASKLGSHGPAFPSVVAFGPNTAQPHHIPDATRLRNGDAVLVDLGTSFAGYSTDVTRSHLFAPRSADGDAASEFERMLRVTAEAQSALVSQMKPGAKGGAVYAAGKRRLDSAANGRYSDTLIHALGHSVGIEPHDGAEPLAKGSKTTLKSGMVIAVEPGITIRGRIGVRKGDIAVVTEDGAELLDLSRII